MEHLPPVGWADVATTHDLEVIERELRAAEGRLDRRIDERAELSEERFWRRIEVLRSELQRDLRVQGSP